MNPSRPISLRRTMLQIILIPGIAVVLILMGVMALSARNLIAEIIQSQDMLGRQVARTTTQFLDETDRLMATTSETLLGMDQAQQRAYLKEVRVNYPRITSFYWLDESGIVLLEEPQTNLQGLDVSGEPYYQRTMPSMPTIFSDPYIALSTGKVTITASRSVFKDFKRQGMLVAIMDLNQLQTMIGSIDQGNGGKSFIVDSHGVLVLHPNETWVQEQRNLAYITIIQSALQGKSQFNLYYDRDEHNWMFGNARPMPNGWVVAAVQPAMQVARPLANLLFASLAGLAISLGLFVFAELYNLRQIANPIQQLVEKADTLASGHYDQVGSQSLGQFREIISLEQSFNRMVEAVQERDRTLEEKVEYRTHRLRTLASLSERMNTILDPQVLLNDVVNQAYLAFGYYHINILLLNPMDQLVAKAGAGKTHLGDDCLEVIIPLNAEQSLIARAARSGKPVVSNRVKLDEDWLPCEILPDSASELAVPIIFKEKTIGVLDVQHDQADVFEDSDMDLFRSLANQIGIALNNARLYDEMETQIEQRTNELRQTNQALTLELSERQKVEQALRYSEEQEMEFSASLTKILSALNELATAKSFDALCLRAVELGRELLTVDRIGIWFLNKDHTLIQGSYGVDEDGNMRDERSIQQTPYPSTPESIISGETPVLVYEEDDLYDHHSQKVGKGPHLIAGLWNGSEYIGYISVDNLISQHPITSRDAELWRLYSAGLAHLCTLKQTEQALNILTQQLEQRVAERTSALEAKARELETFAYSVSHDLKAPLRGIDGYSRLLLEDHSAQLGDEAMAFLKTIRNATEQMNQLINDLLVYSRLERRSMIKAEVDLHGMIQAVIQERRDEIEQRGVKIEVNLPSKTLVTDTEGLTQAMRNLLDNALKFTHNIDQPSIEIGGQNTAKTCILWVKDNGIGFDMQYHDRIFEIFQRLHRAEDFPGTGIGLALVRKAMQRIDGHVWAESQPGHGAIFYLEIPL